MKTLIFNGSPRNNGGTATLIRKLEENLTGEVNVISSYESNISPCVDCRYCWTNDKCSLDDEMQKVYRLIDEADNIIIASPIYFGELTGSLLSLMSRLQFFCVARRFRNTEMLSVKKRNGALILVDGGDGYTDPAMSMGKSLLRKMKSEFIGAVYFSGTENVKQNSTAVPLHILAEVKELSINLSKAHETETDEELRARIYPIILSEYNPAWSEWFAEEKTNLERLICAENVVQISHYGSTSVPGLLSKPTVDILLEIVETVDIENLIALMPDEYICLRREGNSLSEHDRLMIIKGYTDSGFADRVFHIHVRNPGQNDELYFRDYLIAHPETAAEYAELKRSLFKEYEHDRDGYTAAKGEFIRRITEKAKEGKLT